jgi:opacity protein-like surface antigen
MKKTLFIAVMAMGAIAHAQDVPEFQPFSIGYQWSLSGKQYATFNYDLRTDFLAKGLNFTGVAGYELKTGAQPSMGFGLTYRLNFDPVFMDLGAFMLFPQNDRPDVGIGLQFGVKF